MVWTAASQQHKVDNQLLILTLGNVVDMQLQQYWFISVLHFSFCFQKAPCFYYFVHPSVCPYLHLWSNFLRNRDTWEPKFSAFIRPYVRILFLALFVRFVFPDIHVLFFQTCCWHLSKQRQISQPNCVNGFGLLTADSPNSSHSGIWKRCSSLKRRNLKRGIDVTISGCSPESLRIFLQHFISQMGKLIVAENS